MDVHRAEGGRHLAPVQDQHVQPFPIPESLTSPPPGSREESPYRREARRGLRNSVILGRFGDPLWGRGGMA